MTFEINETHDPNLKSWIESANAPDTDFPIQNLPYLYYDRFTANGLGTVIGDYVLDLSRCYEDGLFDSEELNEVGWKISRGMSGFNFFDSESSLLSSFRRRLV